jgi:PAS domain S-box-containing protein
MKRQKEKFDKHRATAVVVNDDPTQLNVLTGLLQKEGLDATAFESAEAALVEMNAACPPDLIITDLYMPGIDGWRFCRLLRSPEYEAFNAVPILVVSATFAGDEASSITADLGANAFLPSPVDGRRFIDTVRAVRSGEKPKESLRVLVVEDSRTLAGLLAKRFEEHGYQADVAFSRREASKRFTEAAYDIAVLDYHLPDGLGDALLQKFRMKSPNCVCVMITTDPDPKLALSWMKAGAAAYLRKPFDPEYLIEQCIRARRERALLRVEDLLEERTQSLRDREAAVKKHLLYEQCISDSVRMLSETSELEHSFQQILEAMGKTVLADRSYIFLVEDDACDGPCMTQIHESCAESVSPQIGNPDLQHLPFETGAPSLFPVLQANETFCGIVAEMAGPEREILGNQGILSILIVPVFVNRMLWGFIGFDDCTTPREWQTEDVQILQTIAEVMGATISRRQATETLESKTKEQRLLLDTIDTQVWYLTDIETYGQLNQAHADYLGVDVRAIAHKRLAEFVSQEVAEVCKASNIEVFQKKRPVHTEEWIPNADGEERLVAITKTPKLDANGKVEYVVCAGTDITERVQAEEALREQRDFSESLIETAQTIILVLDTQGRIVRFNPYMAELVGYRLDEVKGKDWFEIFLKPGNGHTVKPLFQNAIDDIQTRGNVNAILSKDGREILVEWYDKTLKDNNGHTVGLLAIGQDITERARLQQRLKMLEKNESLDRMTGAIAHLFNNHLAAVIGNLELLADDLQPGDRGHENLKEAQTAAHRAAETSGLMLTFLGQSEGKPVPVDLPKACRQRIAGLEVDRPMEAEIRCELPDSGPVIRVDRFHLDQIVSALVTNAWESLEKSGEVCLSVHITSVSDISDTHRFPLDWEPIFEKYACLRIADTGCGMDDTTIGRIFDPFFTDKFTGRGLGLPVVLGIVKASEGCVTVESEPGRGSVFQVFWPLSPENIPVTGGSKSLDSTATRGEGTILLVEDHEMVRKMAKAMINRLGFEVLMAKDGKEAVEIFRERWQEIHLVLTDLTMPQFNGWDTLEALRRIRPDIPVILTSGYDQASALDPDRTERPQAFLNKPYQMDDLKRALARALGGIESSCSDNHGE